MIFCAEYNQPLYLWKADFYLCVLSFIILDEPSLYEWNLFCFIYGRIIFIAAFGSFYLYKVYLMKEVAMG